MVGPTAVGKTAVAINVATHYKTEIVSADSRQIFREMTIGTAKPTSQELDLIPHHFINSHSIHDTYDAAQYGVDALECIRKLFQTRDHVVLCGGSGMYIRAVCEGFDDIPKVPDDVRSELAADYNKNGIEALQYRMKQLDPNHFESIDTKNPHRLMRALEVVLSTGLSISTFQNNKQINHEFEIIKFGLDHPRKELYDRIDQRMDKMIANGLFDEAANLYPFKHMNALQTVGYQEIFDFMDEKYDRDEAIRLLKRNSRRYAKRQLTWFKRDKLINWVPAHDPKNIYEIVGGHSNHSLSN